MRAEAGAGGFVTKWLQLEAVDVASRSENGGSAAEGGPPALTLVASVEAEDRAGDVIEAAGWELEAYARNPVVLWAHDYLRPPIGRSLRTWVEGRSLMATIEFAPMPFAQEVRALYVGGFMRGVSVGFRALESESISDSSRNHAHAAGRRRGVVFKRQELLEISAAPVPLNAMALAVQEPGEAVRPRTSFDSAQDMLREPQGDGLTQVGANETIEEEPGAREQERAEAAAMLREIGELWRELAA